MKCAIVTEFLFDVLVFILFSKKSHVPYKHSSDGCSALHTRELEEEENDVSDSAILEEPVAPILSAVDTFVNNQQ